MIQIYLAGLIIIVVLAVILAYQYGYRRGYENAILAMLVAFEARELREHVSAVAFKDIWHGVPSAESLFPGLDNLMNQDGLEEEEDGD